MPVDKGEDNTPREAEELAIYRETAKSRERRFKDAWAIMVANPQGRAVLWDIIERSGKDGSPARAESDETQRMIGRHDYGRELYDRVRTDYPRYFLDMVKENM